MSDVEWLAISTTKLPYLLNTYIVDMDLQKKTIMSLMPTHKLAACLSKHVPWTFSREQSSRA